MQGNDNKTVFKVIGCCQFLLACVILALIEHTPPVLIGAVILFGLGIYSFLLSRRSE